MNITTVIGVVGPCGAGKSTLAKALRLRGYNIKHIAQEHSYVADMWRRLSNPGFLIYLEVSYENTCLRRNLTWSAREYQEQLHRLRHAREHADLIILTDPLTPAELLSLVLLVLSQRGIHPEDEDQSLLKNNYDALDNPPP